MKKTAFLLVFSVIMPALLRSQSNQVLYFMNLPQKSSLNPAFQPTGRIYIGLPVISDFSVNVDNNFLSLSGLFSNGVISDSTFTFLEPGPALDRFVAGLADKNSVEPAVRTQLFGLAFTVLGDMRISFDITERADANFVIPGDLIRLGVEGNESFAGRNIDLSSLRGDIRYFHEIGFGVSKNILGNLRVGVRAKILSGVASAFLDNNGLNLTVNDDFTHTINADMKFRVSAPLTFHQDTEGYIDDVNFDDSRFSTPAKTISYITGGGNMGLGLDLGAEYRFSDMFSVSASLTDLGYIRWKRDLSAITVKSNFELSGATLQDVYDENTNFEDMMQQTLDTLRKSITVDQSPAPYTTYLPATFTAGFGFSPVRIFTIGVMSQTRFRGSQVHQALTMSANLNLGNHLSASMAYTAANRSYSNLGAGIAFRAGTTQFFALVDNIPTNWEKVTSGEESYSMPESWNVIHARIGFNLVFGNRDKALALTEY